MTARSILYTTALRQLATQPLRVGALVAWLALPLLLTDASRTLAQPLFAIPFAVAASIGIIGLELSSGAMALLFTRAVRRSTYLLARWCAAATIAASFALLQTLAQIALMASHDAPPTFEACAASAAQRVLLAISTTAILALFSTCGPTFTDLLIWIGGHVTAYSLILGGQLASMPRLAKAGEGLRQLLGPQLATRSLAAAATYALLVTLSLAAAIAILNRKELSYASAY